MTALPCPFCGSEKITVEWEPCPPLDATDTNRRWFAECTQCSCQGPFSQKEPQVIPAWNKRADAELLRDKARLDWFEKRSIQTDWSDDDGGEERIVYELYGNRNDREWVKKGKGETVRQAIDAAMSAEEKK